MGFFSFTTADTQEPIRNKHTGESKPVYLIQPKGAPICEPAYDGYGIFGGVDIYVWIAEQNSPYSEDTTNMTEEEKRDWGIKLFWSGDMEILPKLSFNKDAKYDDDELFQSLHDPDQGYF